MKRPRVIITPEGEKWLRQGQMWMYRNNLAHLDDCENGDVVDIMTASGDYLGSGFVSLESHVIVRILTKRQELPIDRDFFRQRLEAAISYRLTVERDNFDNCRLVFGEADLLPGLTVDRYNDLLVCQITSFGMEKRKAMIYDLLIDQLKGHDVTIHGIYERNDVKVRAKEGLSLEKGFYGNQTLSTQTIIHENGLKIHVDVENGQKTGYFLDQKSNRLLLRKMAYGHRVLDCFSHTGGFALNAALGGAIHVDAVDVSKQALDQGLENAKANHLDHLINFIQDDVFDYLDQLQPGLYDMIILDPPAFTKSRRSVSSAYNGYKRINKQAMRLLKDGGYLFTCSCSRYMETSMFEEMLREAAMEAGVLLKQVSTSQQNSDHPILWTMQETSYLKFYIFQIVGMI